MGLFDDVKASRGAAPAAPEVAHTGAVAPDVLTDHLARAKAAVGTVARARTQKKEKEVSAPAAPKSGAKTSRKAPTLPDAPDPAMAEKVGRATGLKGVALFEACMCLLMMYMDVDWALRVRQQTQDWLAGTKRLFRWFWGHTTFDLELALIWWLVKRFRPIRRAMNMHPYATPCEARLEDNPTHGPFAKPSRAKQLVYDLLAKLHGILGIDVGGGQFDQHGRPENRRDSRVASVDVVVALALHLIRDFAAAVMIITMVSLNDRVARQVANQKPDARDLSRAFQESGMPLVTYLAYMEIVFDAAYNYLSNKFIELLAECGDQEVAFRKLFDFRLVALRLDTIMANLPEQITEDVAKGDARAKAEELADEAVRCERIPRRDQMARELYIKRMYIENLEKELAAREAFPRLLENFKRDAKLAEAMWAADRARSNEEAERVEPIVLDDMAATVSVLSWAEDRSRAGKGWAPRCGRMYVFIAESDSMTFGGACRHRANKLESEWMETEVRHHWLSKLGVLTKAQEQAIHRYSHRRAMCLVIQLRDVVRDAAGQVVSYRYNASTSGVEVGKIHGTVWGAIYSRALLAKGYLPPADFEAAGNLVFTKPGGDEVIRSYKAEFGTSSGNVWTTNRGMKPITEVSSEDLRDLHLKGIAANDLFIRERRARYGRLPVPSDFEKVIDRTTEEFAQAA